jgi:hypothetical protein
MNGKILPGFANRHSNTTPGPRIFEMQSCKHQLEAYFQCGAHLLQANASDEKNIERMTAMVFRSLPTQQDQRQNGDDRDVKGNSSSRREVKLVANN